MDNVQNQPVQKSRRDFLKYLLNLGVVGFAASIFYPLIAYLKPPKQNEVVVTSVSAGKLSAFETDSGKIIRFGSKPVIVIRTASGDVRAFSAICTHLGCTVQFRKDLGTIWCACHNGKYDLNGKNISGPPPRPLDPYKAIIKGDEIIISKMS